MMAAIFSVHKDSINCKIIVIHSGKIFIKVDISYSRWESHDLFETTTYWWESFFLFLCWNPDMSGNTKLVEEKQLLKVFCFHFLSFRNRKAFESLNFSWKNAVKIHIFLPQLCSTEKKISWKMFLFHRKKGRGCEWCLASVFVAQCAHRLQSFMKPRIKPRERKYHTCTCCTR